MEKITSGGIAFIVIMSILGFLFLVLTLVFTINIRDETIDDFSVVCSASVVKPLTCPCLDNFDCASGKCINFVCSP